MRRISMPMSTWAQGNQADTELPQSSLLTPLASGLRSSTWGDNKIGDTRIATDRGCAHQPRALKQHICLALTHLDRGWNDIAKGGGEKGECPGIDRACAIGRYRIRQGSRDRCTTTRA